MNLASLFDNAGYSPPAKSDACPLGDIETKANEILAHLPDGPIQWEQLNGTQQVGVAFLIFKNQHDFLQVENSQPEVAKQIMNKVAGLHSPDSYSALSAFLRPGGDDAKSDPEGPNPRRDYWGEFLETHPEWVKDTDDFTFTIFTHNGMSENRVEKPFVRFQDTSSTMVCYIVSAAQVLLYYMMLKTGSDLAEGIETWGINVGRFMRNNLSDEQIFRTIFLADGGYPQNILNTLLTHATIPHPESHAAKTRKERITSEESIGVFYGIEGALKEVGPLIVCGLRPFPAYMDPTITEYSGDWETLKDPNPNPSTGFHACVVVGVKRTRNEEMGGVKFLVQDSLPGRPFVSIGLDLLRSMGIKSFESIEKGVDFLGTTPLHQLDVVPIFTTSGSPHVKSLPSEVETGGADTFDGESLTDDGGISPNKLDFVGFPGVDGSDFIVRT